MPYDIIVGRNDSDKKDFGKRGLAFIGKGYVSMGNYTSLSNPIYLDVARSHVILVAGKRGSGKCLCEDALITLSNGAQIPIKELEKNTKKILSLNDKLKIENSERSEFFSREVDKLLKIKLRSGKEIKLTPEHPLLTIKGWTPVQELTIGKRIATPRVLPAFGDKEMPKCEIKILAYLIAEGHTKKIVLFSNSDEKIVKEFENSLNEFDSSLKLVQEKKDHYRISSPNWKNKVVGSNSARNEKGQFTKETKNIYKKRSIRKLIERENLFGFLSKEKQLSQNLLQLKKDNLSLFLNRLFSCDGSIYKKGNYWEISYSSSSEKLIRQVHSLLLRFAILSKIRNKKIKCNDKYFDSYEIVINSENALKFIGEIGFFGDKEKRQEIAVEEIKSKMRNTNVDTIPKEIWETYKPKNWASVGRAFGYKFPKAMRERINYSPSRQTLIRIAEAEQHQGLKILAQSDIFWDEIISIENLEGKFKVYDICVPENHNFIANDIVVHNSYTIGTIAESLSNLGAEESGNISSLIFDTMGIFWTMKYKNEKDAELLSDWGLEPKKISVKVFAPFGYFQEYKDRGIDVDEEFAIKTSELEPSDWVGLFELNFVNPVAVVIESVISKLKENKNSFDFEDIYNMISRAENVGQDVKNSAVALFDAAKSWGVFDEEKGTDIKSLVSSGQTTVIDLSMFVSLGAFNVRALIIGLVSKKLFNERMVARKNEEIQAVSRGADYGKHSLKREMPIVWIFIDEAHEFLARDFKTPATDALVQLLREGRQPGISLVLATQQPGKIHTDAITQSDIVISHRVTAKVDVEALNEITQSYLYENISDKLNNLPRLRGSAIILDDNSERIYPMRIRPRFTWHGGESPATIKKENEAL